MPSVPDTSSPAEPEAAADEAVRVESSAFVDVDWARRSSRIQRPDARTLGLLAALAVLVYVFAYDYVVAPETLVTVWFFDWDVTRVDWLSMLAVVFATRYGVVPLLASRERSERQFRTFLRRPGAVLAVLYLVVFVVVGLVGPDQFFALEYPRLKYRFQPPVFSRFPMDGVYNYNCKGVVSDGYCYGSWQYPLGTTRFGQNLLKLVAHAMRIALQLSMTAGMIMVVLATVVGTLAGYYGGLVDDTLMGYVDIQQTVPAIVVYLILSTIYLGNTEGVTDGRMFALILVFGLLNWGGIARLVRSEVLERREKGYVRAAKAAGASDLHVIRKHIVPNSKATIVTSLTRQIPLLVLAQVALAFLNLNRVDSKSLGRLFRFAHIGHANRQIAIPWHQKWWISVFPVLFLIVTVVAFNVLGDTLRDVLTPREKVE
jgi:peptide/nickel transport system permease protein